MLQAVGIGVQALHSVIWFRVWRFSRSLPIASLVVPFFG